MPDKKRNKHQIYFFFFSSEEQFSLFSPLTSEPPLQVTESEAPLRFLIEYIFSGTKHNIDKAKSNKRAQFP